MELSLDNLKAFIAAVDEGSFSAAARVMGKAQSRISTAISNLEIDLGVSLFDRSGKYPVLTPEGKALIKEARQIVERCRALQEHADIVAGGMEPFFRLAVDELIPPRVLADVLDRFYNRFPDTELEMLSGTITDISDMVLADRADMGIDIPSGQPVASCEWRLVGQLGFIAAAAAKHPLAKLEKVAEEDLGKYLQLLNVSRVGESDMDKYLFGRRSWYFEDSQMVRELILKGKGWGFIAEHLIIEDLEAGRMVKLPVRFSSIPFTCGIYLIWKKGRFFGNVGKWLTETLTVALAVDFLRPDFT